MQILNKYLLVTVTLLCCISLYSQSFKVSIIDVYGNRHTHFDTVLAHIGIQEGDSIDMDNFNVENIITRLKKIPGIKHITVNPVCCDTANNLILYIGIGETDSVILKYRNAPQQDALLTNNIFNAYTNYVSQLQAAILNGQGTEDDSQGYALIEYAPARKEQNKFIEFANQNFLMLANVLKNAANAEHRAAAAQIIAYSSNRTEVVNNLLYATDDPDEIVRNNAVRAIAILAKYVALHPELKIIIPSAPFIKMMNSIVWTDRNKGASVLLSLTKNHDPEILKQINAQAMPSIIEMAKWKNRGHAAYSFIILGRIAGEDEALLNIKNYSNDWSNQIKKIIDKRSN